MPAPYRVNVQGFSVFERNALASYFRLAANRSPAYEQAASPDDAHFLIVDADHAEAVRTALLLGRVPDAVFIGSQAPAGSSAWMMRPIDPLHVLRELDAMAAALEPQRVPPTPTTSPEFAGHAVRTIIQPPRPGPVPSRRAGDSPSAGFVAISSAPPLATASAHALLIDDSEIALRFLESKLQSYDIATACATTSAQAIELHTQQAFDLIFIDVELGADSELDGLALCQHIKREYRYPPGRRMPVVALVSAHASEIDRVRGTLAGADAYLGKPLDDTVLRRLLQQHGIRPRARPEAVQAL